MTTSQGFNYIHDTVGNRLSKRIGSQVRNGYTWDSSNRLRTYSDLTTQFAPGAFSVGMGAANYTYLPNGLRCTKVRDATTALIEDPSEGPVLSSFYDSNTALNDTTTRYRYDGQMTLEEDVTFTQGENTYVDQTSYLLGGRGIEMITARRMDGPTPAGLDLPRSSFPIYDGFGNMIATLAKTSAGFDLANEKRYDVWGSVRSASGASAHVVNPNKQFAAKLGHTWDGESGLIYMRARYYEPTTGRFVSEDPAKDGINWYRYADNVPTMRSDANGKVSDSFNALFRMGCILTFLGGWILGGPWKNVPDVLTEVAEKLTSKLIKKAYNLKDEHMKLVTDVHVKLVVKAAESISYLLEIGSRLSLIGKMHIMKFGRHIAITGLLMQIAAGTDNWMESDFANGGLDDWGKVSGFDDL